MDARVRTCARALVDIVAGAGNDELTCETSAYTHTRIIVGVHDVAALVICGSSVSTGSQCHA